MTENELMIIEAWAKELPPNATVVEVGSFYGRSAYCFGATAPSATIHCFDWWNNMVEGGNLEAFPMEQRIEYGFPLPGDTNSLENFLSNTRALKNIRATRVKSVADLAWPEVESVDIFFLDAEHANPSDWEYLEYWLPRVKAGGWIAGHDLYQNRLMPAVNDNVARLEQLLGKQAETYTPTSSLWRIQK